MGYEFHSVISEIIQSSNQQKTINEQQELINRLLAEREQWVDLSTSIRQQLSVGGRSDGPVADLEAINWGLNHFIDATNGLLNSERAAHSVTKTKLDEAYTVIEQLKKALQLCEEERKKS